MKRTRYQMLVGLLLCGLFGFSAAGFGAWRELEPIPTGRWGLAAAAVGDTVYAIAGQDDSPKISKVEAFDIAKGKWEESKEIPQGRVRHAVVTFRGKIYVFGGSFDGIAALGSVQEYDPKNNAWTNKADMPTPRIAPMVVAMSSNIYVIGGATDLYFPSPAIEVYNPTTDTWEKKADMPNPRWGAAAAGIATKGKIYIFGGATDFTHEESTTDADEYDTRTETWTAKKKLQRPLHNFSASFVNSGKIYVMGGQKWKGKGGVDGGVNDPDWTFYDDVWEYWPEKDEWNRMGARMPKAKSSYGHAVAKGKIYVAAGWAGGAGDENGFHVYQPPGWPFPDKFSVEPQNKLATIWGELKSRQ